MTWVFISFSVSCKNAFGSLLYVQFHNVLKRALVANIYDLEIQLFSRHDHPVLSKWWTISIVFQSKLIDWLFHSFSHSCVDCCLLCKYVCMWCQDAIQEYFGATAIQYAAVMVTAVLVCAFIYWRSTWYYSLGSLCGYQISYSCDKTVDF